MRVLMTGCRAGWAARLQNMGVASTRRIALVRSTHRGTIGAVWHCQSLLQVRLPVQELANDPNFQLCVQHPNQLVWLPDNWLAAALAIVPPSFIHDIRWHSTYNEPGVHSFTLAFGGQGVLESKFDLHAARGEIHQMDTLFNHQNRKVERRILSRAVLSAAAAGQLGSMVWLRRHGAVLTHRGKDNRQPMHVAALNGQLEALKWLAKRGV